MITQNIYFQLLVAFALARFVAAQLPSVWKPQDMITYFCSRWYHQCKCVLVYTGWILTLEAVIKNDTLYLYGGVQTVYNTQYHGYLSSH